MVRVVGSAVVVVDNEVAVGEVAVASSASSVSEVVSIAAVVVSTADGGRSL